MDISTPSSAVKRNLREDTPGEREVWLSALKIAATRSRFETTFLENLFSNLRHKRVDCAGAHEQLKKEGLLERVGGVQ
jgi:hypothetical protein